MPAASNPILLYDGVCGLCNRFVQFILKHDRSDQFRFAALQSEFARRVLERHGVNALDLDTVYLVEHYQQAEESLLNRSDAAIAVGRVLGGWWLLCAGIFRVLPNAMRNWVYNAVAQRRYAMFGKYDACVLPNPKDQYKFLDRSSATSQP